ncbi:MAG: glycoside hydrolase family 3 protein [Bacilli bacterium]|nr:glycoside hydrolase family 3 protein [Bacilli bacterium]
MKDKKNIYFTAMALIILFILLSGIMLFHHQEKGVASSVTPDMEMKSPTEIIEKTPIDEADPTEQLPTTEDPNQTESNQSNENQNNTPSNNQTKPNTSNNKKPSTNNTTPNNNSNSNTTTPTNPPVENPNVNVEPQKPKTVTEWLNTMSLEEKIAQMIIISFDGKTMNTTLQNKLAYNPGGVILFSGNISDYNNTTKLISDMQANVDIPLFISIDQEGGRVQRIKNISGKTMTIVPPMWGIGATNDYSRAYQTGRTLGQELKQFGINMDFAPVIDVVPDVSAGVIKDRSFGSDPYLVAKMGTSLARGLTETGVTPVYKHFPGHGATITDSHVALPIVNKTKEELLNSDLVPFKEAISANAKVIMIGHLAVPNITGSNIPASLSKDIITGLLKNELGYNGLVITDALNMKAITDNYSEKNIYELAINAGVNILLMPKSLESAINSIKQSVNEGKISEQQINTSVRKILELKMNG